jgi:hypothetical protein
MIHDRSTFESSYAGQAPWDIGKPQKPFIDVAERITGSVLDAGCGTGDTVDRRHRHIPRQSWVQGHGH